MKKIMSWILLAAMLLGMFAGCGKSEDPTQPSVAPVETTEAVAGENNAAEVIDYLQAIYKDSGAKTAGNFERFGVVRIAGVPYEVVWTADVGEDLVKIIVNDDGTVTIDVNEKCTEDAVYVLTATVTDANGNIATASWEYLLPGTASLEEMHATIDEAYALDKGEALSEERVLTGVIKTIDTPYSAQYQNITVTIQVEGREDKPIMCYRLKGEGAAELNPGDTITVQGLLKNYNGTIEFDAGCQLVVVEKTGTAIVVPTDPHQILEDVYALGYNESLPYGPVSLTGRICAIDEAYSEQYKNITVSIIIDWYTIKCYRLSGAGVEDLEMNDIITVQGFIKKYGTIREFDKPTLVDVVKVGEVPQPADQLQVVKVAYALDPGWTVPYGDVTLTGTITKAGAWSDKYGNVTVTMTVDGDTTGEYPIECYRMVVGENASKELKAAARNLEVGDRITAKGFLINYQYVPSGNTKVELNCPELVAVTKTQNEESNLSATLTTELKTGDKVVIVAPVQKIALSSKIVNNYYPKGVSVSISGNTVSGFSASEVLTVTANSDGTYSFSHGGQTLGMASSYSSMYFGNPNDDWSLTPVSTGVYNVKNTVRGNYMQYATTYSTWQTSTSVQTDKSCNLSFYKYEGELGDEGGEGTTSGAPLLTQLPVDGDVIAIVNSGKAMTTTASGTRLAGETANVTDSKLAVTDKTAQLTVSIDDNGYYTFTTSDGKYLTSGSTGNSLTLASAPSNYSLWTVESAGNNKWYIKSVNARYSGKVQSLEYYNNNFTTYGHGTTAAYQMELYLVSSVPAGAPALTSAPANGSTIAIVNSGKAMTTTASGTRLTGEAATVTDGYLTVTDTMAQLNVSIDDNGYYTFTTSDGKYLTSGATGNSLTLASTASNYSLWTVESAGNNKWYIKNVNAKYSGKVQSLEYYNNNFTTYGHGTTALYQMELYLISGGSGSVTPPVTPDPTDNVYMTSAPKNGDKVVIVAPAYNKALSTTYNGFYNNGSSVAVEGGKLTYASTDVWTVIVNSDGSYSFEVGGQKLSMDTSYTSTPLGKANDKWTVTSLGGSLFNIVNVGRANYALQWYDSNNNWSAYNYGSPTTDNKFQLAFYLVEAGSGSVTPDEPGGSTTPSGAPVLTSAPANGSTIAIVNSGMAMKSTASGSKLAGEAATVTDGYLTVTDTMAQLNVSIDANGYYTFTCGGKYLTSGATGNSLTLASAPSNYSLWTVESAGNNKWYIKNVNAKYNGTVQSMEYYSGFTTYGHKTTAIYQMELYLISSGAGGTTPELEVSDISEALKATTGTELKITGYVNMVNGDKIYVQDSTGAVLVNLASSGAKKGDTITVTGAKADGNVITGTAAQQAASAITQRPVTIENLADIATEDHLYHYMNIDNELTVIGEEGDYILVADEEDNQIKIYDPVCSEPAKLVEDAVITYKGILTGEDDGYMVFQNTDASDITIVKEAPGEEPEVPAEPVVVYADFYTIETKNANGDSSYTNTYTTSSGWTVKNSAIQTGGTSNVNPQFTVVGPSNAYKAPCLNGKTSAPGSLTSPTLTGGISKLNISYTKMFTDTALSATITITDKSNGATYTKVLSKSADKDTKYEVWYFEWVLDTPIKGDFTISVVNNCPSNSSSNKDRLTILDLAWTTAG